MEAKKTFMGLLWSEEEAHSGEKVIPWRQEEPLWEYFEIGEPSVDTENDKMPQKTPPTYKNCATCKNRLDNSSTR